MNTPTIIRTTQAIGLTSGFMLSGLSFTTSYLFIHHLFPLPVANSTKIFERVYYNGMALALPLAVVGGLSFTTAVYLDPTSRVGMAVAAALLLAIGPWTGIVMLRINNRLSNISYMSAAAQEKISKSEVVDLLKEWRWKNYVRAAMGFVAGAIGVAQLIR